MSRYRINGDVDDIANEISENGHHVYKESVLQSPTLTFLRIPDSCSGDHYGEHVTPTRVIAMHGRVAAYCDACMLDRVLKSDTVKIS